MAASDLLWDLLLEHLDIDNEKLEIQKEKMRATLLERYGNEIAKNMSLESFLTLSEKVDNEVYGKKNFVAEINAGDGDVCEIKILSYKCPMQKVAGKNPKICGIHRMHYRVLGELCGWDIKLKTFDPRGECCTYFLKAERLED